MPKYPYKFTPEQRAALLQTFDRRPDMTARQIAEKHGVSYETTLKWIGHLLQSRMKSKFSSKHPAEEIEAGPVPVARDE